MVQGLVLSAKTFFLKLITSPKHRLDIVNLESLFLNPVKISRTSGDTEGVLEKISWTSIGSQKKYAGLKKAKICLRKNNGDLKSHDRVSRNIMNLRRHNWVPKKISGT